MEEHQVKLNDIFRKVEILVGRYNELKQEYGFLEEVNKELSEQNKQLKEQVKGEKSKQDTLEQDLKQEKLSKMMVPQSDEEKTEMKRKVNEFIKEIDRCVAMLND